MADTPSGDLVEPPHVSTKMDETAESSAKRENEENESENGILNSESPQACPSVLTSPRLRCPDQSVIKSNEPSRSICKVSSVLRPAQLNGNVGNNLCSKSTFLLNPSRLNPFAKIPNEESSDKDEQKESVKSGSNSNAPKFLPLLQNGSKSESTVKTITPTASTSTISQSNDFVFGQNIHDRVVSDSKSEDAKSASCTNENGTSDMLFSSALKETPVTDSTATSRPQGSKSLSESAREYEESRAVKRKYEEVEVKTGEEGETNVIQITCKLFAFDKIAGGNWQERGRGVLRLNDLQEDDVTNSSHSRLVFRTSGSFRVVLNTKIWAEMTVQRASDKSIRLTAFDSTGEIKVFLLTGNPEDIKQLQKHLEVRVKKEMELHKSPSMPSLTCHTVSSSEPETKKLAEESKTN